MGNVAKDSEFGEMIRKRVGSSERRQERFAIEEQWLTNMLFWSNKPDFFIANGRIFSDQRLYEQENEHEVRYRVNLVRARTDTAVAKVLGQNVGFEVRPPSASIQHRNDAEMSNRVFDHVRSQTDFHHTHLIATQWAAICGSSFIKCYFDPLIGDPTRYFWNDKVTKTVIPEVMLTPPQKVEKEQLGLFEDLPPGDLASSVCSPFGLFYDSSSRDAGIPGCQWVAEKHYVDKERLAERFDIDPDDIQTVEDDAGLANYEEAIAFMSNDNGLGIVNYARPEEKRGKRTLYVELWQRPSKKHKKGLRLCWTPGLILNSGSTDNPYIGDRSGWAHIPYVKVDWKLHPGRFWGVSLVEDMLIPQYYLNRTRSAVQSFVEAHGQPATYVGKNSGLDTDHMTSQVGRVYSIAENSQIGVKIGPVPQMPVEVLQAAGTSESDLNKVASQSEMAAEKLPGQIRSGAGMRAANEQTNAGLSIPAQCAARAVRDCGRVWLAVGKLYLGPDRLMRFLGEDDKWVVESFNAMNLVNDVVIVSEPDVSETKSAKAQEMLDAIQAGAFNPQFDRLTRTTIMKGLHFGSSAEFYSRQMQAEKHAERAIQEMIADPMKYGDEPYPVFEWQDHEAEIITLVSFMYSGEFTDLAKSGRNGVHAQGLVTTYWKQHVAFMQQAAMQQMQMIEATKGAPGSKGQASQPAASSAA